MSTFAVTTPPEEVMLVDLDKIHERRPRPCRMRRFVRGRVDDPVWVRPTLLLLLTGTALLYLWGLGASGWANSYYSAAVQAGAKSWKAFFFGSFDASNAITIDKSPASLWVMELSARVFGVSSWSILVPQALEGVAAVGVLYLTVRRWFTPAAGLIAGAIMATTPVAVLMFRFNNPDALLVLLLTLGAYALTRALEHGQTKWLLLAFSFVGFGFLAKMLQALLVVPVFGLVYLVAAPPRFWTRVRQLILGGVAAARVRGMVGRDRRVVARGEPAVHRRLAEQQPVEPDLRIQRFRPVDGKRDRQRRGWRHPGEHVGCDRTQPALQGGLGWPDLVAAPHRALSSWSPCCWRPCANPAPTGLAPR